MPSNFNPDKYRNIFEQRYGKGSYSSGLSSAREIGTTQAKADFAKQEYKIRLKEAEKARKEAEKAAQKRTYDDALDYWMQPENKSILRKDGAAKNADNIRNDPRLKAALKEQGYNLNDYIDAMYAAASDGQFRSEREFKGFSKQLKSDTTAEQKARDKEYKQTHGMTYQEYSDFQKTVAPPKVKKSDDKNSLLDDILTPLKRFGQAVNPFDDVSIKEAIRGNVDDALKTERSPITQETTRGLTRIANTGTLGTLDQAYKKTRGERASQFTNEDRSTGGKVADFGYDALGYLIPGAGAYRAVRGVGAGLKPGAQGVNKVRQLAQEGALTGGMLGSGEVFVREGLNPQDTDYKDNLTHFGLSTALGAVADPALYGIARIIKGARGARNNPSNSSVDDTLALPEPQQRLSLPEPTKGLPEPQLRLPQPNRPKPSLNTLNGTFKRPGGLSNPIPELPSVMRSAANRGKFEQAGVNFGYNTKNWPKARKDLSPVETPLDPMNRGQSYWQGRYEEFANQVNSNYDLNNMTPEALEDLWSSFARYDEPVKLDQVVDLAYPKGFEAPQTPKAEPTPEPPPRTIKDDLQADPRINDLVKGLYPPTKPISRRATLDEMFKYMEELAPKKAQGPDFKPLEFKRSLKGPQSAVKESAASSEAINPLPKLKQGRDFEPITAAEEPPLLRADDPIQDMSFDPKNMKDISGVKAATSDVYRIFRDAFGKDFEKAGKPVLDKLDSAKKNYVGMQENWAKKLKTEVVDKLGIKKGSKESALVQKFGEKNMTLAELKQVSPDKWKDIVKADQWFRQAYDEMYSSVNKARKAAYPNSPDKQVPKLDNYYRHFREMNGLTGLKNIFDSPSQIDPHLAGMSQHTNPSSKWHSFMQKRGMGPYKEDAVGGFLEYIPGASYATNIDPVIPVFKNLRRQLADGTEDSKNINNFIEFLYNYSNDLAGKTNPYFDRNLQRLVGRKTMSVLNWVNNRVKKNVILGNIGSTLAQMANIPNGVAYAKQHSVKGATKTLTAIFDKNAPVHKSEFLKERYLGKLFREFDQRLIDQPEKMAGWMIETSDRIGTSFVWNSVYEKGLKQGVKEPIKYADDITRKLVAGRGVGEVPLLQKAKTTQLVMPFTLEVANLWRVMGDFVKAKDFGAIATLFVGNYLLNKGMEETRGSAVTFDPIDAILDSFEDEELSGAEKGGRLLGEVLTNVPLGQHIAGLYPEDGKVANIKGPTRKELFGDRDPQRFGTGLVAANGLSDAAFKFALPFGGNQLKKTLSGIEGLQNEGSYIKDGSVQLPFVGENQKLRYPIESTPWNSTKAALFGQSATSEAQEYYDKERRPLSENQTTEYDLAKQSGFGKEFYDNLMKQRLSKTTQKKIKEITEDQTLTKEEKQEQILILLEKLNSPK